MRRFALLFPGQASQYAGMGRELADRFPESREVFDAADRALEFPISRLCFGGSAEELALTENTQPAILTVSVAALRALEAAGLPAPAAAAGHSLGEYSAQVASGALEFDAAVRAVRRRGRFMQEAVPVGEGAMAAVLGLELDAVAGLCREHSGSEVLSPANLNCPGQIAVAGHTGAVERLIQAAPAAGALRAVRLPVSAPFHCALMQPAAERLRPVLESMKIEDPAYPVYSNVDASPVSRASEVRDALIRQVVSPVRWQEVIEAMMADGIESFVEVGPGKVLSGLVRRIRKGTTVIRVGDPEGVSQAVLRLAGVGSEDRG